MYHSSARGDVAAISTLQWAHVFVTVCSGGGWWITVGHSLLTSVALPQGRAGKHGRAEHGPGIDRALSIACGRRTGASC